MAGQQKVISSTFNVSTVDETVSLQAQYAPNDNPTSSQIHNTWQEGDLYMRTKMTNENTWSDWHKIVGENGGETDFSFAISSNATSTNSSTPPSDCTSESSWHDTPQAVTEQKPYLWMRVKKKVWNESTQQYDVSSTSYARLSAEYNFIVDLVNEMTNLELDENGNTVAAVDFYFKVQAYYGTKNVLNDCTITASCEDVDVTVTTTAAKTTGIRVQISQGIDMTGTTNITVTVTHSTYGARTVVFTMAGIKDGKNAVLQELLPSLDAISFARQDDGSLSPANRSLSLSIKKTQGGVTTIQTLVEANLTIRWSASSMPTTSSSGNNWGNGTATGITWNNKTMEIASGVEASNVYIAMFNSSGTLLDRETIPIIKDGKHGKDAFTVDLENEMKNVALTESGNTLTAVDFYFKVQAFYGTKNVLSDNECTVSASCSDNNVTLDATDAKTTGIRVQVAQNVALANSTDITVTVAHTTYGTRIVVFTLAGVRGGANAVLQELLPSRDNITFARLANGGLSPSSRDLTLSIKKTQGGVTTIQTISASGLTIKWSVSSMPASSDSGYNWGYGSSTGITWSGNTMQIANTVAATNIYIAAFNSDGTLIDRETIPVVKDGNNGDDAPNAFATPAQISIPCYSNGYVKAQKVTSVLFSLKVGTNTATVTSCAEGTKPTGVTVQGQADNAVTITVGTSATASGLSAGVTFTVTGTYGGKTYSATVTVALIGSTQGEQGNPGSPGGTGPRGKMGRAYYYATEWNPNDNTKSFLVDDTQAPYFSNAGSNLNMYYAYNAETNGYYTMSQMAAATTVSGSIDWNSEPWSLMTDDFKYLITEALFTKFAKLGSAIFNEDFMYSKYLNNELSMYYSYSGQSISRSLSGDYALVVSQTSLPVIEGKQYKISITCYHNSGYSDGLYSRVFYNTKEDWSGSLSGSSAFISVSSNTSATYDIDFIAIQTGYVRIYNVGYGTITKIVASQSESYENVSPMFINTDDVPLLPAGGVGTSDVTTTSYYGAPTFLKSDNTPVESVVTVPIPVVSSRTYKVTFNAKVSGGTGYVALCRGDNDSVISSYSTITNTELESQELNISNYSYTGNAYLRFCVSSSPYTITVNEVYIKCPDAFVPQAIVDWLTGYAHFSGDRVRFNPDGSGHLANQNILWNANGDLTVSGYVKKKKIIINSSNYNSYIKTIFSSYTVLDISKCGSWIELSGYITSGTLDVELPNLSVDVPASSDEKDFVRSFGGTVLQIYNRSTTNIEVILSRSGGVSTSTVLIGQACTYECIIDGGVGGNERVRWMEISNPFTIL